MYKNAAVSWCSRLHSSEHEHFLSPSLNVCMLLRLVFSHLLAASRLSSVTPLSRFFPLSFSLLTQILLIPRLHICLQLSRSSYFFYSMWFKDGYEYPGVRRILKKNCLIPNWGNLQFLEWSLTISPPLPYICEHSQKKCTNDWIKSQWSTHTQKQQQKRFTMINWANEVQWQKQIAELKFILLSANTNVD